MRTTFPSSNQQFRLAKCVFRQVLTLLFFGLTSLGTQAQTLAVYTYDSFVSEWGPGPKLQELFAKRCACEVNFIAAEDGVSILNRLKIEGETTKADVIVGLDNGLMVEAENAGLFQPHTVDTSSLLSKLNWQSNTFVPFDYGYFAFVYNAERVADPADSLQSLLSSNKTLIYQDPRTSTPGQGLLMWMKAVYGKDAGKAWQAMANNTVTVTKGWWEAYSMFLEGAADYVLSYSTSPAYHLVVENKSQFRAAHFNHGHVMQIEIAGISKFSKQQALANKFLQFLISQEAQEVIPVTNWMLPVVDNVALPDAFNRLINPKTIGFTPEQIAEQRKTWIREWRQSATK